MTYLNSHNGLTYSLVIPPTYEKRPFPGLNEWVDALRSGNYKQGQTRLFTGWDKSYCCLGVLSKIQGRLTENGCDGRDAQFNLAMDNPRQPELNSSGTLPKEIYFKCEKFESESEHYSSLADLNDSGMTFEQIATLLELLFYHVDETKPTNDGTCCSGSCDLCIPVSGEPEAGESNISNG